MVRRWIIIEWSRKFENEKADSTLVQKLASVEELSGILNILLGIVKKLLERRRISTNKTTKQIREEWQNKADIVRAFLNQNVVQDSTGVITKEELYSKYVAWCITHNYSAKSSKASGEKVKQLVAVEEATPRIVGKKKRAWKGIKFKEVDKS